CVEQRELVRAAAADRDGRVDPQRRPLVTLQLDLEELEEGAVDLTIAIVNAHHSDVRVRCGTRQTPAPEPARIRQAAGLVRGQHDVERILVDRIAALSLCLLDVLGGEQDLGYRLMASARPER